MSLIRRHAAVSAALSLVVLLAIEKPFMCISGNFEQIKIELALCTTTPILEISCVYRSGVLAVVDLGLYTKFEISAFARYEDTKGDAKCGKVEWLLIIFCMRSPGCGW